MAKYMDDFEVTDRSTTKLQLGDDDAAILIDDDETMILDG